MQLFYSKPYLEKNKSTGKKVGSQDPKGCVLRSFSWIRSVVSFYLARSLLSCSQEKPVPSVADHGERRTSFCVPAKMPEIIFDHGSNPRRAIRFTVIGLVNDCLTSKMLLPFRENCAVSRNERTNATESILQAARTQPTRLIMYSIARPR